ncbi:MAG: HupE/UreJ family protein [Gemmatimonadetes bacterium]|nr:HupE/UreJ family protein [Gemmatimonadota bacterium]
MPRSVTRRLFLAALGLAGATAQAHEVPQRVNVVLLVRPAGHVLQLLVRAPMGAMRDMEFPLRGAGYLDIPRAEQHFREAAQLWLADYMKVFEDGRQLPSGRVVAARASLPSDRSFGDWGEAMALVRGTPLPPETEIPWQQALLDVLLEYPITADSARFAIDPNLAHLGIETSTLLRFQAPGGPERAFTWVGNPGRVDLDPGWWNAASRFVVLGFEHIMDGIDHLLFVLCLVIPVRRVRPLVGVVTSFTAAHSVTLIAAAFGIVPEALWFPPLIETLIAASIVFMAFENIIGVREQRRWMLAFGFGLVHGFGFSFALRESLQFAGSHLLTSLLAFNVGVELGQLLVVLLAVPVLSWLFRRVGERMGAILLSALVAHAAWHWMTERGAGLGEYAWEWPAWDVAFALSALRAAMLALIVIGVGWMMRALVARLATSPPSPGTADAAAVPGNPASTSS